MSIMNKRLEIVCGDNNLISDCQFGFYKGRSTLDAIFILDALIQHFLKRNTRVYIVFVDLKRCLDTIYRKELWFKLHRAGIQGKFLRIIRDMYSKVKTCVKQCSSYSEYFQYAVGLRQCEVMSPLLFSLFIDDLEMFLQDNIECGLNIDDIVLTLLLFADDMAILANTPENLQTNELFKLRLLSLHNEN